MNQTPDDNSLYKLLGELSADMKHVLRALETNKGETLKLREDLQDRTTRLDQRLNKVESFNMRVMVYAGVFVTLGLPAIIALINYGISKLLL